MKDARIEYADIIDMPHHQSTTRKHMSLYDRAAQFSPFSALSGYDEMITEEARETGKKREQEMDLLNLKLGLVSNTIDGGRHPLLTFTVFVPDKKKAGGRYEDITGVVKKVDMYSGTVILGDGLKKNEKKIEIQHIQDIHGELVDYLDEEIL